MLNVTHQPDVRRTASIFHRPRQFFIGVEALGPPGYGSVFAVGLVRFEFGDPCHQSVVLERWRWNVIVEDPRGRGFVGGCEVNTLAWLADTSNEVRRQLVDDQQTFATVWQALRSAVLGEMRLRHDDDTVIWSDDWSNPAWLDVSARSIPLASVRDLGFAADSCAIVELAKLHHPHATWPEFQGTPHVAVDDAAHGARTLCRAVHLLEEDT